MRLIFLSLLISSYIGNLSAEVMSLNYVGGVVDKVSKPDLTSILLRDVGDKDRLARSFVSGWLFKKRKITPIKGNFVELTLTDKEFVTVIQTGWTNK